MTRLETIQKKLAEALRERATLNVMLNEQAELIARATRDHVAAVRAGKSDAELRKLEDQISEAKRQVGRIEINIAAADEDIPTLELERDEAARAESLEQLKEKSSEVVRACGVMDKNLREMINAKAQIDMLLAECAQIADSLGLQTAKYRQKFQVELRRGLDWQIFKTSDHGSVWSAVLKEHYAQPLAKQIESLLLGAETVENHPIDNKVVKLTDAEQKAAS